MSTPNSRTRMVVAGGIFQRAPLTGAQALARYEPALRAAASAYAREHVVVASVGSAVLAPGAALVPGRPSEARLIGAAEDIMLADAALVGWRRQAVGRA